MQTRHFLRAYQNLNAYLSYAKSVNLSVSSTVFKGTCYELQVKENLQEFLKIKEEDIRVTGGTNDGGVDLMAKWDISQFKNGGAKPQIVDMLVQCKTSSRKLPSKLIRELTGAFGNLSTNDHQSVFMLVSNSSLTKEGWNLFNASEIPLMFMNIEIMEKKTAVSDVYLKESYNYGMVLSYVRNKAAKALLHGCSDYEMVNMKIIEQITRKL